MPVATDVMTTSYQTTRDMKRRAFQAASLHGRDIAPLPPIENNARRVACAQDFRRFCETYLKPTFGLPWSMDHYKVIAKIEEVTLVGGLYALAMPRGSGKTSLCEAAALWALLYAHRHFVAIIGADESHASDMLDSIKTELGNNDELLADFPEVCYPIRALGGMFQRAYGQLYNGISTNITWSSEEIVLPSMPHSPASGGIVRVAGLTGRVRGMKFKRIDGTTVRPDLALVDDPQTDQSARSPMQCNVRAQILSGAVLGLAGPGEKIAALLPLTVVRPDDMADKILNRQEHPDWQGERTRMVYQFPTNTRLWERYAELRAIGLQSDRGLTLATEFYRENREAMDEGARVSWEARYNPDEISAIQHAMNLKYRDEVAFMSEYQNDPLELKGPQEGDLDAAEISAKINGLPRQTVPNAATVLTMYIDIQATALFYVVAAWEPNFTGYVVDYGTFPEQKPVYYTLKDIRNTLGRAFPGRGVEGAIHGGLEALTNALLGRAWEREDMSSTARIDRCLIDANWGTSTNLVYNFCRVTPHGIVMPAHGRYIGASSMPMSDYRVARGDRVGLNWKIPTNAGTKRTVRHLLYDTNYWKSFLAARLATGMGDPGCVSLYGREAIRHRMFAEHMTAEYRVRTEGRGRTVDEWKLRSGTLDNHFWDCLVGCAVAASMSGSTLLAAGQTPHKRQRVKLSEVQAKMRASGRWQS